MAELTTQPSDDQNIPAEVTLNRNLGLFTITMIGVGGMIGAGIFVLTGSAAGVAGPALVLVFILNGLVTLLTAMVYAELGSAFPEAGGGYLWVKEGLGGIQGFLAGWMSWFAHTLAGSLYALGFGRFAAQMWIMAGVPMLGLSVNTLTLIWMTVIILVFTTINYRGVTETGSVGNTITVTKIIILGFFALFGIIAMTKTTAWETRFTVGFMPNGLTGVFMAMGLTFIAFEGYEIIAQSGEEVKNPARNIPRAVFLSVLIAVVIYVLVGVTAIGATTPPPGLKVYQYLGEMKEIAIVEIAQQIFPRNSGAVILLFSGLVSTMSALNATTFSSSRVSFAMGRDHNLPDFFARIHPTRHTPYLAVLGSGGLMLLMAWLLPLEGVAAAADIMFLLLFLQVNLAGIALRRKMPTLKRTFRIPWVPVVPITAIVINGVLTVYLVIFNLISWIAAMIWVVIGLLAYFAYFKQIEAMEKPKEILQEEVLVSRNYSVVVPVSDNDQANILGQMGSVLAQVNHGEVLALHVIRIPQPLTLGEGRLLLKSRRPYLEAVIRHAKQRTVPVHTVIRLGRNTANAIRKTVEENAADLLLLGWPGYTRSPSQVYGSVIDELVSNPPTDLAVVRYRKYRPLRSILVPVAGGPNSRKAVRLAVDMARQGAEGPARVVVCHIAPLHPNLRRQVRINQILGEVTEGIQFERLETKIVESAHVISAILETAKGFDLIVIGTTRQSLLANLRFGNIPEQVAQLAAVSVVLFKSRSNPLQSFINQMFPADVSSPGNGYPQPKEPAHEAGTHTPGD